MSYFVTSHPVEVDNKYNKPGYIQKYVLPVQELKY